MGCTTSTAVDETDPQYLQKMQNSQLEMLLMQSQQKEKNQVKLLLLGAGESGKSTVLKQMKLLHKGGFSHQERLQYCNIIWADTVALMQTLIIQARKLDIPLECDDPNSELHQFKRNVLNYKPLSNIDASSAGGVSFLKNYVMKYNEAVATKRQMRSTGKADAGWDHDSSSANLLKNELDENLQDLKGLIGEESKNTAKTCSKLEIADSIKKLWEEDPGIMRCFQKSNQFQFEDSAPYFFDNVHSYARDDYLCSDDDILKGRIKTTGITETNFNIDGIKFKILDAGGQRSERKKWIHCFQDITCALFVLAVSEYDQMLFEDERVNRMHEAIMLFESLCNSKWFANTPFILFLNKVDLLEDKVRKSPLRKYFPDFKGKSNDAEDALQYFENLFLSLNRLNKPIYVHRTCATDTESMKFVLTAVTDMIIQQNLKKSGLI
ncbi:hypothetical protein CANARDRAFT_201684 [[Candida] arabinofermentans NRRL YB-2248]|uniref:Guanine nucleotide-binding protein subunit alpha n=1 Tax=[Candida] arabinofermentans NRRL YB-2248 TaxID=983967 RepID=A0A1E4SXJ2_9ASCO|nr:hypothetical protein CANARDRAFT_201684 [[Candida] arabinofermentans NRRL YB-2248]